MSEQTATECLRRLLDERGVEWWAEDDPSEPAYYFVTKWFANGSEQTYEEIPAIRSRSLKGYCITPERAIAATLGNDGLERTKNGVTERERDQLKAENAKLRRLCKPLIEYTSQDRCEGCACKSRCRDGQVDECWMLAEIRELASELGMEVDG